MARTYKPACRHLYGYVLRLPVRKKDYTTYQDGSEVSNTSVKLYYDITSQRVVSALRFGVAASWPRHRIEGLWALAVPSVLGYALGCTELRTTSRVVLEVLADDTIWNGRRGALQQCPDRGTASVYAPIRWAVRGKQGSTKLPVKIMSVNVLLPRLVYWILSCDSVQGWVQALSRLLARSWRSNVL